MIHNETHNMGSRYFVTGANGFVGSELVRGLQMAGKQVTAAVRHQANQSPEHDQCATVGDINSQTDWQGFLDEQDVVIHLANRAHIMHETVEDPLVLFREINVEGTKRLAEAAAASGVKRFVFLSSIKVNGEATPGRAYCHTDAPAPDDPYGLSKWEAEQALTQLCQHADMELVIIRPPLIYGPGMKGNLAALKSLVNKPLPLPLANINNRRDLVSLKNLTDLITLCSHHPAANGETFLCCDGEAVSTPQLIRFVAQAQQTQALLFPFPVSLLDTLARLAGKTAQFERLSGDLEIDMTHTRMTLDWAPPVSTADSMQWAFAKQGND